MFAKIKNLLLRNTSTKQTIAKNTFWLFFGIITSRLIRAGVLIYAARLLGAGEWGAFNYTLSLAAFFTIFIDFGVNAVITRDSAKNPDVQERYFSTAVLLKSAAFFVVALFVILLFPVIAPHIIGTQDGLSLIIALMPLVVFVVGFDSMRDFATALCRAWEKMEIEAGVQIFTNSILFLTALIALHYAPNAKSLAIGYVVGSSAGMLVAFYPFRKYLKNIFRLFSLKTVKGILSSSWPFGIMGLLGAIMLNTDSVMIGWLGSITDVGYYGAGQRIVQLIYVAPGLIATAFFPTMAKITEHKERLQNMTEQLLKMLMLVALPLTVGGVLLAKQIILLVYGPSYTAGTNAFLLMNLTYIPVFASAALGNVIFALNHEKKLFSYVILATLGNFLFDLWFIPMWGIAGAALSTVLNQFISIWYLGYQLKKITPFKFFTHLKNITLASIAMGIIIAGMMLIGHVPVLATITIGGLAYFIVLALTKEPLLLVLTTAIQNNLKHQKT